MIGEILKLSGKQVTPAKLKPIITYLAGNGKPGIAAKLRAIKSSTILKLSHETRQELLCISAKKKKSEKLSGLNEQDIIDVIGDIPHEIANKANIPSGKVVLKVGNIEFGEFHIKEDHRKILKEFKTPLIPLLKEIGFNYDSIRRGKEGKILLVKFIENKNSWIVLELRKKEYSVVTFYCPTQAQLNRSPILWQRRYTLNSPALKGIDATLQGIKSQGTLQLLTSSRKTNDGAKIAKPSELAKREYKELPFTGQYLKLLAKPAEGFKMMISAEPGTGKSYFSLQFAKYLTQFGRVLYATSEEYGTATLAKKLKEILVPDTVDISGTVKGLDLSPYKFIFMDSINDMDLSLDEFKALKQAHPETAFILIMQNNKDGSFKGRNEWPHEMDIVVHGVGYKKFNVSKNRFK